VNYRAVIFDLDGTLLDSLEDLADSMNHVLARQSFPVHAAQQYRYFVGDGIAELVWRVLPEAQRDAALVAQNISWMSAEYEKRWNKKTRPYAGIVEMLGGLTEAGLRMAVLSNKPDAFTKIMVPALLPGWNFAPILGARPGVPVKPDPQAALEIADQLAISPTEILYLGDTATDMLTANAAGMMAIGVAWGFRTVEELLKHGAQSIIYHPAELMELIRKKT
jgi:phosphoglycolate phosphatase